MRIGTQPLELWPVLATIPQEVFTLANNLSLEYASVLRPGEYTDKLLKQKAPAVAESYGCKYLGAGCFNMAFTSGPWVVKVGRSAVDFQRLIDRAFRLSEEYRTLFGMVVSPTIEHDSLTSIQRRAPIIGDDLGMQDAVHSMSATIGNALGLQDLHGGNWGVENDSMQVFDPMWNVMEGRWFRHRFLPAPAYFEPTQHPKLEKNMKAILEVYTEYVQPTLPDDLIY